MSEMTQAERLGVFFELAADATPNSDATRAAQAYFKFEIMGLPAAQAQNSHLQDKDLAGTFLNALSRAVDYRTQDTQMQIPQDFESLMDRLPAADKDTCRGAGQVLGKLALQCGAREAETQYSFGK